MLQSIQNLHVLPQSWVMKQLCHITLSIWPIPVSQNRIPLIDHLWEIDFFCSWGGFPEYEPWNNFAPDWLISKKMPLTNQSWRDLSNLDVTTLDQMNLVEISRRDCLRLTEFWSGLSFFSTELSHILLFDVIEWSGLPLLNEALMNSAFLVWSIKMIHLCSMEFSGILSFWTRPTKMTCPCLTESLGIMSFEAISWSDLPLVNKIFRHYALLV